METQCAFYRKLSREFVCRGPSRSDYDTFRVIYSGREPLARSSKTISGSTERDYSFIRHFSCDAAIFSGAGPPRERNKSTRKITDTTVTNTVNPADHRCLTGRPIGEAARFLRLTHDGCTQRVGLLLESRHGATLPAVRSTLGLEVCGRMSIQTATSPRSQLTAPVVVHSSTSVALLFPRSANRGCNISLANLPIHLCVGESVCQS